MKFIAIIFSFLILSGALFAQSSPTVIAAANDQKFTLADLPPGAREAIENLPKAISEARRSLLEQQIADILFETEAAAKKTTVEKLIENEVYGKVAAPTDKEIKDIYAANRGSIGNKTLEELRPQIVAFLRRAPEQMLLAAYLDALKKKYKVTFGADVNAANLRTAATLATINGKPLTAEDFEAKNKYDLYDLQANVFDQVRDVLEATVLSALITAEAKAQNIASNDLIAREITDKMRDYSDEERERLQSELKQRLFAKYNAKFSLTEPAPLAREISTENQPASGRQNAPVTVVMFTDFQCPACAATHPVLTKIMAEYGDKIRFVVRDFPLVNIHQNAYRAALAANAAFAQGKFFEYIELLYQNQNALDAASLKKYAKDLGLNQKQFDLDLESEKLAADVRRDMADGAAYGISGTPTIFINGVKVRTLSAEDFRRSIDRALRK